MEHTMNMIVDVIETTIRANGPIWTISVVLMYTIPYLYFIALDDRNPGTLQGIGWLIVTFVPTIILIGVLSWLGHDFGRCFAHGAYMFTISMFLCMARNWYKERKDKRCPKDV